MLALQFDMSTLNVRADFPASKAEVKLESLAVPLSALVTQAAKSLNLESEVLSRYAASAVSFGNDVVVRCSCWSGSCG